MRIEKLKIYSSQPEKQLRFYRDVLQLDVLESSNDSFEIKIGYSTLKIEQKENASPYHIAFHIPALQEMKALEWLKKRVVVLKDDGNEIVDFSSWKAKSVYFYDADKNIIEFISRRDFFPSKNEVFSGKRLIGISEIGLATESVQQKFNFLNEHFSVKKFTEDYETFCATGDEEGLFIVINKERKTWFPSNDKAYSSEFEISIKTGEISGELTFKDDRLEIL
ncbi:MAG TPA: VOC family protein [Salinimicrobium sp.]|nr:VOC family protein [Salinimicrobium sp.]